MPVFSTPDFHPPGQILMKLRFVAGDVTIGVEGEAFERSLEARLDALQISRRHLLQCLQG